MAEPKARSRRSAAAPVAAPAASAEARRLLWALVTLCAAVFAALAPRLLYADLDLDYPFMDGDSYDWIGNGLFLAGHEVRYSGRPPLLPLALALLDHAGLLRLWPLVSLGLLLATIVGFYTLAARLFPAAAAFAAALLLLADYSLQGLALDVMADVPASCLLLWSARAFLNAREEPEAGATGEAGPDAARTAEAEPGAAAREPAEPDTAAAAGGGPDAVAAGGGPSVPDAGRLRRYAWSGLLAGLSALTQPMAILLPPAAAATMLAWRRRDLATRWPWIGALLATACPAAWLVAQRTVFAAFGDSLLDPWKLLGFHLSSLRFYLWSLVSMLGLPACLLLVAGIALAICAAMSRRASRRTEASLFALLLLASLLGFVVFAYRWNAKRLLVYALWPAALLVTAALARIAPGSDRGRPRRQALGRLRQAAFGVVALLAIGGAALPLPEPARDPTWAALLPLPPWAAHLDVAGAAPPTVITTALLGPAGLAGFSTFGRAARAWAERPRGEERASPAQFANARAALYLFHRPEDGGGRYRTITRLSNALLKPVRFIPRSMLAPYWGMLALSPPARLGADYLVYRTTLPGVVGGWLLVTPGDRPLAGPAPSATAAASTTAGTSAATPAATATPASAATPAASPAAARAAAIAAWVGSGNAYVVLFPRAAAGGPSGRAGDDTDPAEIYLLFLLRSTEVYVVEPRDAPATRAQLARSPIESERRIGGAHLVATRVRGLRTAVVDFAP